MIKTVSQLPDTYIQAIEVTLNDAEFFVVARNTIMLLVALVVENIDEAVDFILHLWYSALLRDSDLRILDQQVRPLIQEVCEGIKGKMNNHPVEKTWTFGRRSLRLVLKKSSWNTLLSLMHVPEGLTAERADKIRLAVMLNKDRKDYIDRHYSFSPPARRVARNRFRNDGLLLPFGSPRRDFRHPNP